MLEATLPSPLKGSRVNSLTVPKKQRSRTRRIAIRTAFFPKSSSPHESGLHSFTWLRSNFWLPRSWKSRCPQGKKRNRLQKHPCHGGSPNHAFFFWGGMHFLYPLNLVSWEVPNYCTFCELRVPYRNLGLIFVCDVFESQTSSHHLSAVFPTMLLVYRAQQGGGVLTLKSTTERLCPFVWKGWLNNVPLVHGQLVNPSNFNCKSREQLHATSIFNLPVHLKLVMHLAGLVFVFLSPMSSLWNWHDWHACWISKVMMVEAFWWWRERYLWPRNFTRKSFLEKKGPQDSDLEDPSKKLHPRSLT